MLLFHGRVRQFTVLFFGTATLKALLPSCLWGNSFTLISCLSILLRVDMNSLISSVLCFSSTFPINMLNSIAASSVGAASSLGSLSCCVITGSSPGGLAKGLFSSTASGSGMATLAATLPAGASATLAAAVIIAAAAVVPDTFWREYGACCSTIAAAPLVSSVTNF